MGVVSPIGEQGSVLPKVAALKAGWDWRCAGVQLNRFCASGLEAVNMAAMKVRSGWEDLVVAGGVESMSRVPIGSDGGAWAQDPETNSATLFVPQGIGADLIATLERLFTARTWTPLRSNRKETRHRRARRRPLRPLGRAGERQDGPDHPGEGRVHQAGHHRCRKAGRLKPAFEQLGRHGL